MTHSRGATLDQWRRSYWQKPTDQGTRYYAIDLHQDLWGGWILTRTWGRCGTQLGRRVNSPCASYEAAVETLSELKALRQRRGYRAIR